MINRKYKLGKIVLLVESEIDYKQSMQYSKFLTQDEPNYTLKIKSVDSISEDIGKETFDCEDRIYTFDGEYLDAYYKNTMSYCKFVAHKKMSIYKSECVLEIIDRVIDGLSEFTLFRMIGIEELTAVNSSIIFHSSVIKHNDKAILFVGPCGMGKSTQADLWNKYRNCKILNGDKAMVYEENGIFMVGGFPYCGSSTYCEIDCLPIEAVIELGQSKINNARKENEFESFLSLLKVSYIIKASETLANKQINFIEKISKNINVFKFECSADESAVDYLEDVLCH